MAGKLTDQDIANSMLNDYKLMCSSLNTYISEAQNVSIRNDYMSILQNSYDIQKEIFDTMNKKGWYEVKPANVSDIAKAQNQYANVQL